MAEVCVLPPNEQRVWFVNLHIITRAKEMNGNLMMIPDTDHGQCQKGGIAWGAAFAPNGRKFVPYSDIGPLCSWGQSA